MALDYRGGFRATRKSWVCNWDGWITATYDLLCNWYVIYLCNLCHCLFVWLVGFGCSNYHSMTFKVPLLLPCTGLFAVHNVTYNSINMSSLSNLYWVIVMLTNVRRTHEGRVMYGSWQRVVDCILSLLLSLVYNYWDISKTKCFTNWTMVYNRITVVHHVQTSVALGAKTFITCQPSNPQIRPCKAVCYCWAHIKLGSFLSVIIS